MNRFMQSFFKFLLSVRFALLLIIVFASLVGYGTFIENDFGRSTAKALIYNKWWFELILVMLAIILVANMERYNLFKKGKEAVLAFHLAFIIILFGAGITRYFGYEGMMHIREGESSNSIISDEVFLQIKIDNRGSVNPMQYEYDKPLLLSAITSNSFSIPINFLNNDIVINYKDFLPNVIDTLVDGDIKTLHIIVPNPDGSGMKSEFLKDKEQRKLGDYVFTFNNPLPGAINLSGSILDSIFCNTTHNISSMSMLDQSVNQYIANDEFKINTRTLYQGDNLNFVLKELAFKKDKLVSTSSLMEDGNRDALIVEVLSNGERKEVSLIGGKGVQKNPNEFVIGNLHFNLSYGSKYYYTPFQVYLRDFQLERYPGSDNESSYASEVTVIDGQDSLKHRIFMNNVLDYKGYRFFQSRFDKDEKGTVLSVNHDRIGTLVSYFGYFLLTLGIILSFFNKKNRFAQLNRSLKNVRKKNALTIFLLFFSSINAYSSSSNIPNPVNINHAEKFERLLIQDQGGRIKPVHTLCSELLRKISRKQQIHNQTPTQIILGMIKDPKSWMDVEMIKINHDSLKEILGIESSRAPFRSFHDSTGSLESYKLKKLVKAANNIDPSRRGKFEKAVILADERYNICYSIYNGTVLSYMFRFFPLKGDLNNTWHAFHEYSKFSGNDSIYVSAIIPFYYESLLYTNKDSLEDWSIADTLVSSINNFQIKYGKDWINDNDSTFLSIMPSNFKRDLEIVYNKSNVFSHLFIYYFIFGLLLTISSLVEVFNRKKVILYISKFIKWLIFIGILIQTIALISRWIISNHAPWTNGYESMIYIAWATMIAGLVFHKKSSLTLAATSIVSALLLMVAHLNWLDPEITNIVPVLNSYWLMIHVSIITASYGFLSLGAILGLLVLWVIIFTTKNSKIRLEGIAKELTLINEKTLMIGLFMLTIGTFLGGVWASESWGRYWGWDPKETWALISIFVYVIVLHIRLIPSLSGYYIFNLSSLIAIGSIIMTYFGVNYYLSGLHSYAKGDPMPIPTFVYYLIGIAIITAILAKIQHSKYYKK